MAAPLPGAFRLNAGGGRVCRFRLPHRAFQWAGRGTSTTAIGVILDRSRIVRAHDVGAAARRVEDLGFDALFVGDHLVGAIPMLDGAILLAAAAAATKRITLGFAVMVPALRHPVWAAKQIATLQHLSGDRLIVGVGSGAALHGERAWDAVGVPYAERGARLETALGVLPDLIARQGGRAGRPQDARSGAGRHRPPIWVGGNSRTAVRRAAHLSDGWFPSMLAPIASIGERASCARSPRCWGGRIRSWPSEPPCGCTPAARRGRSTTRRTATAPHASAQAPARSPATRCRLPNASRRTSRPAPVLRARHPRRRLGSAVRAPCRGPRPVGVTGAFPGAVETGSTGDDDDRGQVAVCGRLPAGRRRRQGAPRRPG
jgi:hypothetical protein